MSASIISSMCVVVVNVNDNIIMESLRAALILISHKMQQQQHQQQAHHRHHRNCHVTKAWLPAAIAKAATATAAAAASPLVACRKPALFCRWGIIVFLLTMRVCLCVCAHEQLSILLTDMLFSYQTSQTLACE